MEDEQFLRSFAYIQPVGRLMGIVQFPLSMNPSTISNFFAAITALPYLLAYLVCIYVALSINADMSLMDEVIIVSFGRTMAFLGSMQMMLVRYAYYFFARHRLRELIVDVGAINTRLQLQQYQHYASDALRIWALYALFGGGVLFVHYHSASLWQVRVAFVAAELVFYGELMYIYKIAHEMARQCRHIHRDLFTDMTFVERKQPWSVGVAAAGDDASRDRYLAKFLHLREMHLAICQLARRTNAVFAYPALSVVLLDFFVLTLELHDLCNDIVELDLDDDDPSGLWQIGASLVQTVLVFGRQTIAIYTWTHLTTELKATVLNIHKLWNVLSLNDQIGAWGGCIQLAVVQMFNAIPKFNAFGVFDIDWPIIISIISAASTYVVILIQFGSIRKHADAALAGPSYNMVSQ